MNEDGLAPCGDDADAVDPALTGNLRTLLGAHVDNSITTDDTWRAIERSATGRRTPRTRRRGAIVAALAVAATVALLLVVRLDGTDDGGQVSVGPEPDAPAPDPLEGEAPDSWVRLLGHVPGDAVDDGQLWLVDLRRARQVAGVEALPDGASADDWRAQSQATFGVDDILASPFGIATPEEVRTELGFGHEQVDQVLVVYGANLPRYVATGRFDRQAIGAAVAADPLWGPDLVVEDVGDLTIYRWGEDGLKPTGKRSPVRDLGTGGRLVVGDGWVAWASTDDDVAAIVEAAGDPRSSAAADQQIREAVEAGDDDESTDLVVAAVGRPDPARLGGPYIAPVAADLPTLQQPQTWSGGTARSTEGRRQQFRFGYTSEAQAAANLDAWRGTWDALLAQAGPGDRTVAVEQRGSGLVADLRLAPDDGEGIPLLLADGTTATLHPATATYFDVDPPIR